MRSEPDTRATLIDPKLKAAGWTDTLVAREHYYRRDYQYTPGRVILLGDRVRRGESRKVDYLLRLSDAFPIAVVEAKAESEPAEAGLEQAKRYARDLGLAFAYSTNGHCIIEFDFFANSSREMEQFPRPDELWDRWWQNAAPAQRLRVAESKAEYGAEKRRNPLLHLYCPETICEKTPFYFQEVAIREVIERLVLGRKRVLSPWPRGPARRSSRLKSSGSSSSRGGSSSDALTAPRASSS
jgi:type I restriction enzyme R subunit